MTRVDRRTSGQAALRRAARETAAVAAIAVAEPCGLPAAFPGRWFRWSAGCWIALLDEAGLGARATTPAGVRSAVFANDDNTPGRIDRFAAETLLER